MSLLSTFNECCRALRTEPGLTPLPLGEPKPFVCHPGKTGVRRWAPQFRLCVPTSDALGLPPRPFRDRDCGGDGRGWGLQDAFAPLRPRGHAPCSPELRVQAWGWGPHSRVTLSGQLP